MPQLLDVQAAFATALLDPEQAVPETVTSQRRRQPKRRFDVYRNNVVASLIDVLQSHYPVVCRLVGEEFFRATARAYLDTEQPSTPVLAEYGGTFSAFLDTFEPAEALPYLPDVARFEWLQVEAYHAADVEPLTADDVAAIEPNRVAQIVFELHPSARLLSSPFPIISLWRTNTDETDVHSIDLTAGGEDAVVIRPFFDVIYLRLRPGGHAFLTAIREHANLADAATRALGVAEDFDVQRNLAQFIDAGVLAGWHLEEQQAQAGETND